MIERLTFVDENDRQIGSGTREEAWGKGYYTRNIRVVLRDESGRFLSQKRSIKKNSYPGMWTVAASGHVDEGESWDAAAQRETQEEIGVSAEMNLIGKFAFQDDTNGKKIRQLLHVYEGVIDSSIEFQMEEDEVEDMKWFEIDELKKLIKTTPEQFTPSLREIIDKYY